MSVTFNQLKYAPITVVIPTRNRGTGILDAVKSVLANEYPDFKLIVVDQSSNDLTELALAPFMSNPRFCYIRSNQIGAGAGRNLGISEAQSEFIASTDDDCEVPSNWLRTMVEALNFSPRIGVVFGNVLPGPHDPTAGFIPTYERTTPFLARNIKDKNQARGIGACLGLRRSAWQTVGGFDPALGPGSRFKSCDDGDLAVKMLLAGYYVYETPVVSLIHHGFRTWEQGKSLTWRDWFSIGGAYVKHVKMGHLSVLQVITYEGYIAVSECLASTVKYRRPRKVRPILAFASGLLTGVFTKVDKTQGNYLFQRVEDSAVTTQAKVGII